MAIVDRDEIQVGGIVKKRLFWNEKTRSRDICNQTPHSLYICGLNRNIPIVAFFVLLMFIRTHTKRILRATPSMYKNPTEGMRDLTPNTRSGTVVSKIRLLLMDLTPQFPTSFGNSYPALYRWCVVCVFECCCHSQFAT